MAGAGLRLLGNIRLLGHTVEGTMTRHSQRLRRSALPDRRRDPMMADLVDVGLTFAGVFGRESGLAYFRTTTVAPFVYERVLLGKYRQTNPSQDPDGLACAA